MGIKYSERYRVPFYESDAFQNIKISGMLAEALQMSGVQSNLLGRSDVWLAEQFNYFWAVIEHEIDIVRLPKFNEEIIIETEATSYNKFFCYRNFWFKDLEGNVLVTSKSTWVLMDRETRKVERVDDEIVSPYESEKVSRIVRPHQFIKKSELENAKESSYTVRFSHLDMNGHVNNAKYYDWASDMLDLDFHRIHQPEKIFIKYNREVRYGEAVVATISQADLVTRFSINDDSAQIEIHWRKIEKD